MQRTSIFCKHSLNYKLFPDFSVGRKIILTTSFPFTKTSSNATQLKLIKK